MTTDPRTMLFMSNAIAFVASAFLMLEWHLLRERSLAYWSAGFGAIVAGCTITPLREQGFFIAGIWVANGLLVVAHIAFLFGTSAFAGKRPPKAWTCVLIAWLAMLAVPEGPARTQVLALTNSLIVALLSLKCADLLGGLRKRRDPDTTVLAFAFLGHGAFYLFKAFAVFLPGAFINLTHYSGLMISVSLFEGIMMEVALALSIVGTLRRRREQSIVKLAEHDPLTGLLNRRGFEARANALLRAEAGQGALLLLDIDHFKSINDGYGHPEGDRLLIALGVFLNSALPENAVYARLGGDEFAVLLPGTSALSALTLGKTLCQGFARIGARGNGGTLSIGCATYSEGSLALEELQAIADRALYDAKRQGRNRSSHRDATPADTALSSIPALHEAHVPATSADVLSIAAASPTRA
ncbi:MAG: GGDEF domain-containing protein [Novosphingobium sp.]|nr:GGDEF domain-containing protein [Novosphingobium sp.]